MQTQKQIEEAVDTHKPVIKQMEAIGYGLLKDGDTFYQLGMELDPRSGVTFSMRQAYVITQALKTIATKSAEREIKTLETVLALLNGDKKQVDVLKTYAFNKLKMLRSKE